MLEKIKEIKKTTKENLESICKLANNVGLCKSATWDCPKCTILASINQINTMLDLIQEKYIYDTCDKHNKGINKE